MTKLVTQKDIDASWYFSDARWSDADRYIYTWPSPDFPHMVSIHYDDLFGPWAQEKLKVNIRQWIDRNIIDVVIYDVIDKSYRWFYNKHESDWDHSCAVSNKWCRFHFSDSNDALLFSLQFGEFVKPISAAHPTRYKD